jgi:hypothetical protein
LKQDERDIGANAPATAQQSSERPFMNRIVFLALLVGGVVLIVIGINAMNSFSSDLSRFFTGSPTDKAVWMLIAGSVAAVVGLAGALRGAKTP